MRIMRVHFLQQTGLKALFSIGSLLRGCCCLLVLVLSACSDDRGEIKISGATMGTTYHITATNPDVAINLIDLQQDVDVLLVGIDMTFSTYKHDSELSRLNQAPLNEWITVSPELLDVLNLALEVNGLSNGAYDISVGPAVDLWGFGAKDVFERLPPPEDSLMLAREKICPSCLTINQDQQKILKTRAIEIDLSSIAKGYAVDQVADLLYRRQIYHYLVEVGGEVRSLGKNLQGKKWQLGIEKPSFSEAGVQQVIAISGESVATSGDYRNFLTIDGRVYSHIIDPRTAHPVAHAPASVTVVADDCVRADAWATALTVLGAEQGIPLADQLGLAVYFIERQPDNTYAVRMNDAFRKYLVP